MYAVEFETEIKDRFIEIKEYEKFANQKVKVIILVDGNKAKTKSTEETLKQIFQTAKMIDGDPSISIEIL